MQGRSFQFSAKLLRDQVSRDSPARRQGGTLHPLSLDFIGAARSAEMFKPLTSMRIHRLIDDISLLANNLVPKQDASSGTINYLDHHFDLLESDVRHSLLKYFNQDDIDHFVSPYDIREYCVRDGNYQAEYPPVAEGKALYILSLCRIHSSCKFNFGTTDAIEQFKKDISELAGFITQYKHYYIEVETIKAKHKKISDCKSGGIKSSKKLKYFYQILLNRIKSTGDTNFKSIIAWLESKQSFETDDGHFIEIDSDNELIIEDNKPPIKYGTAGGYITEIKKILSN